MEDAEVIEDLNFHIEKVSATLTEVYGSISAQSAKLNALAAHVERHTHFLKAWAELLEEGRSAFSSADSVGTERQQARS